MRVNIYAEEMTDRVEIISKEVEGRKFTAVRFYLELPCTIPAPPGEGMDSVPGDAETRNVRGPFIHRPGDDDSAAVTFWGKRDLRPMLLKALALLDEHYGPPTTPQAGGDPTTCEHEKYHGPTYRCGLCRDGKAGGDEGRAGAHAFVGHDTEAGQHCQDYTPGLCHSSGCAQPESDPCHTRGVRCGACCGYHSAGGTAVGCRVVVESPGGKLKGVTTDAYVSAELVRMVEREWPGSAGALPAVVETHEFVECSGRKCPHRSSPWAAHQWCHAPACGQPRSAAVHQPTLDNPVRRA